MVKTTIEIEGMMCGMCESHIKRCHSKDNPGGKEGFGFSQEKPSYLCQR